MRVYKHTRKHVYDTAMRLQSLRVYWISLVVQWYSMHNCIYSYAYVHYMLVAIHTHTILGTDKTTKIQHTTHTHTPHTHTTHTPHPTHNKHNTTHTALQTKDGAGTHELSRMTPIPSLQVSFALMVGLFCTSCRACNRFLHSRY